MIREIIEINEALCNGCVACTIACHEGALEMVDGKAGARVLVRLQGGLSACVPYKCNQVYSA